MKLSSITPSDSRASSFLFIGPQGSGKTIAACSFPNCRLWDLEGKTESLINWYNQSQYKDYLDKIDLETVNNVFDFTNKTLQDMVERGTPKSTEILDSITNASRDIVNSILQARRGLAKGGDRAKVIPGGIILPSWDEFDGEDTVLGTMMGFLFTIQKRYNVNVVVLAHPHTSQGPNGTKTDRIVCKGHKAPQTVLNYFNEVYHFEKEFDFNNSSTSYKAVTKGGTFSRTAWPFLPDKIDFTNAPFYEVLKSLLDAHYGAVPEVSGVNDTEVSKEDWPAVK